jgi:hypothetical protein
MRSLNLLKHIVQDTKSISNSDTLILAANDRRLYAEITNSSDVGIWLSLGSTAVIGVGIYLAPNGYSYEINPDNMWRGEVRGIAASGAGKVLGTIEGQ